MEPRWRLDVGSKARYEQKIDRHGGLHGGMTTECWNWVGAQEGNYGHFWLPNDTTVRAHTLAWEIAHEQALPRGRVACHRCDNTRCVNPDHLYDGTKGDNARDTRRNPRRRHPRPVDLLRAMTLQQATNVHVDEMDITYEELIRSHQILFYQEGTERKRNLDI